MSCTRTEYINCLRSYIGCKESNGTHKKLIDIYNSQIKLPRGYKVKYTDAWCAATLSAVAIQLNATDILPVECGCGELIKLAKQKGIWKESDSYIPNVSDWILYDWNDNGKGDCTGHPEHIGAVESVDLVNNKMVVIEGNYGNEVKRRTLSINGRYIRGYITPLYKNESTLTKVCNIELTQLAYGSKGEEVETLQILLSMKGYSVGRCGIDGEFGNDTSNAVVRFQKEHNLVCDKIVGTKTWSKLLKG